jgi:hypothetical protein
LKKARVNCSDLTQRTPRIFSFGIGTVGYILHLQEVMGIPRGLEEEEAKGGKHHQTTNRK